MIVEAELPFPVKEPRTFEDHAEDPNETLDRMRCRNGNCAEKVKKDPEFDGFISNVLGQFEGIRGGQRGSQGYQGRPQGPNRPQPMGNLGFNGNDMMPDSVGDIGFNGYDMRPATPGYSAESMYPGQVDSFNS